MNKQKERRREKKREERRGKRYLLGRRWRQSKRRDSCLPTLSLAIQRSNLKCALEIKIKKERKGRGRRGRGEEGEEGGEEGGEEERREYQ